MWFIVYKQRIYVILQITPPISFLGKTAVAGWRVAALVAKLVARKAELPSREAELAVWQVAR